MATIENGGHQLSNNTTAVMMNQTIMSSASSYNAKQ